MHIYTQKPAVNFLRKHWKPTRKRATKIGGETIKPPQAHHQTTMEPVMWDNTDTTRWNEPVEACTPTAAAFAFALAAGLALALPLACALALAGLKETKINQRWKVTSTQLKGTQSSMQICWGARQSPCRLARANHSLKRG